MTRSIRKNILMVPALLLLLVTAGCASDDDNIRPVRGVVSDTTYQCSNGRQLTANFGASGHRVAVQINGESHTLERIGPDEIFGNEFYRLYVLQNGFLRLDRFDVPVRDNCIPRLSN